MGESALPVELGRLARAGRLDQLEHLARNGTDMDAADEDGRTCLHLARQHVHRKRHLPTQAFQAAGLGFWAVWSFLREAPERSRGERLCCGRPVSLNKSRRLCHAIGGRLRAQARRRVPRQRGRQPGRRRPDWAHGTCVRDAAAPPARDQVPTGVGGPTNRRTAALQRGGDGRVRRVAD